jgi:hypothetical protein
VRNLKNPREGPEARIDYGDDENHFQTDPDLMAIFQTLQNFREQRDLEERDIHPLRDESHGKAQKDSRKERQPERAFGSAIPPGAVPDHEVHEFSHFWEGGLKLL